MRVPDAPWTTISAPTASATAGKSPWGSACASDPPIVPRLRTCWSPTSPAAAARAAAFAFTSALAAIALWRVHAPITSDPPSTRMPESSGIRAMSTSASGADSRSLSAGTSEWPPASGSAPRPMCSSASAIDPARS